MLPVQLGPHSYTKDKLLALYSPDFEKPSDLPDLATGLVVEQPQRPVNSEPVDPDAVVSLIQHVV